MLGKMDMRMAREDGKKVIILRAVLGVIKAGQAWRA
jgi:hypothetical protein